MKKLVWSFPILLILVATVFASVLQSCGAIQVSTINTPPVFMSFNKVDVACWILGFTIFIGAGFGYYLYRQITKLEDRINQLKHSE